MNLSRKHKKLCLFHIWQSNCPEQVTAQMIFYFDKYNLSINEVQYMMNDSWNIRKCLLNRTYGEMAVQNRKKV